METKTVILFVTAALNLILSLIVYSRGGRNPITRSYAAAVLSVAAWAFGHGMYALADSQSSLFWFYFTYVAGAFIAYYFFNFARIFPNPNDTPSMLLPARLLSIGFPLLVFAGLLAPHILIKSFTRSGSGTQVVFVMPSYFFYSVGFSLLMGWGFFHLLIRYRESTGRQKMQIRYVVAGTGIAAAFGSYFNLWLPWMGDTSLMWLGPHFSLFMIGFISYAIVKHRLMDIRLILSRTIVYSLLLASTLVLYTMLILLAQQFFQDRTGYTTSLVIGSLLIALGFEPLKRLFQKTTEKVFFRGEMDPQRLLGELSETFSIVRDLNNLLKSTAQQLSNAFRTDHTILVALMDHGELSAAASGNRATPLPSFSIDLPLIKYYDSAAPGHYLKMPAKREILLQEELSENQHSSVLMDEGTRANLLSVMEQLQASVAVPIFTKDQFIGLILLGHKRSGDSFFPADLKLLEIVSQQAGVAIENACLYQTLQQQMEELKRSQTQQLIQSAKLASIGELATSVAHEINNPLTSILGFTTLLLDDMGDHDPHKKDLRIIESEALRSRDIVRNLLDFARKRGIKKEMADINQLIQKTLNLLRHQAEISNIVLKETYAADLPTIIVDADQLKQVFINLMKNAFDAMPKGGTLTVTTLAHGFDGIATQPVFGEKEHGIPRKIIEIRFQDTGEGIAKENIPKIFDSFFTTKEEVGTGLGLAVSYGIIERHGGRIEVFSDLGAGAEFVIKLPVKEEATLPRS
ncbi:MAG: GAF domain-containing protein [Nitrospirae bacterium]|nr:GAF domain-containing protein [Nitrospirota bacterium]